MLGKIEGRRRTEQQRTRWLEGSKSYFMDMGLDVQINYVTFSWSGGKREDRNEKAAQIILHPVVSTTTHCLLRLP